MLSRFMRSQACNRLVEEHWHNAVQRFPGAVYLVDLQERLVRGNRAFFDFLGMSPEQACGQPIMTLIHGAEEQEPCPVCRARRQCRDAVFVKRSDDPMNRAKHPIAVVVKILRDADAEPVAILQALAKLPDTCAQPVYARMQPNEIKEVNALNGLGCSSLDPEQPQIDLSLADFFANIVSVFFAEKTGAELLSEHHAEQMSQPPYTRLMLALKVRMLRLSREWTQEELAFKAGLERHFIRAIELAERHVSMQSIEKLALAFGLTLEELLGPPESFAAD